MTMPRPAVPFRPSLIGAGLSLTLLLAACGGGGGGGGGSPTPPPADIPAGLACDAGDVSWTVGQAVCTTKVAATAAGALLQLDDQAAPGTGAASFMCANGAWTLQASPAATCVEPPPAPLLPCKAGILKWQVDAHLCEDLVPETASGSSLQLQDVAGSVVGTSTFTCVAGDWNMQAGPTCAPVTPQPPPPPPPPPVPGPCVATDVSWTVAGNVCNGVVQAAIAGAERTITDVIAPMTGHANVKCTNSAWAVQALPAATCEAQGWQGAALVESTGGPGISDGEPVIAVDATGRAMAVWVRTANNKTTLFGNRYLPTTGWLLPFQIDNLGEVSSPQLAMDAAGNATVAWLRATGTAQINDVYAKRISFTSTTAPSALIDTAASTATAPRLAMNAAGQAVAVWQHSGNMKQVWANHLLLNGNWGGAAVVATENLVLLNPQVSINPSGKAMVLWAGAAGRLSASLSTGPGVWDPARLVQDTGVNLQSSVALDANGNAVAVWKQMGAAPNSTIFANFFNGATGKWGQGAAISVGDNLATQPRVVVDATGHATAVWLQSASATAPSRVQARRYTVVQGAGAWGPVVEMQASDPGVASGQRVGVDAEGNATLVWLQGSGAVGAPATRLNVWANRFTPAGGWGVPLQLEANGAGDADPPDLAVSSGGQAAAVWSQSPGTPATPGKGDIWSNVFR